MADGGVRARQVVAQMAPGSRTGSRLRSTRSIQRLPALRALLQVPLEPDQLGGRQQVLRQEPQPIRVTGVEPCLHDQPPFAGRPVVAKLLDPPFQSSQNAAAGDVDGPDGKPEFGRDFSRGPPFEPRSARRLATSRA